jgi:hypothetical protein
MKIRLNVGRMGAQLVRVCGFLAIARGILDTERSSGGSPEHLGGEC